MAKDIGLTLAASDLRKCLVRRLLGRALDDPTLTAPHLHNGLGALSVEVLRGPQ
jgi:hypothetical protein